MAGDYLKYVSGKLQEALALLTSAGAGSSGEIPKLDAGGKLDISFMPSGIGGDATDMEASENLAAGDYVNVWLDGSDIKVRKADASDATKPAHGFTLTAILSAATDLIYWAGINNQVSGMTEGAAQYLSLTAGDITETAPSGDGEIAQHLGWAISPTEMYFNPNGTLVVRVA